MSIDYIVYTKDITSFSIKNCEKYISSLGLDIEIHPEYEPFSHTGFLPIRLYGNFISEIFNEKSFLSGFEICLNQYRPIPAAKTQMGLFKKIFEKKVSQQQIPLDNAIKDASHYFSITCSSADSFERLLSYAFSAYLCKYCSAIFDDPQTSRFLDNEDLLVTEVNAIIDNLKIMCQNKQLLTHNFIAW